MQPLEDSGRGADQHLVAKATVTGYRGQRVYCDTVPQHTVVADGRILVHVHVLTQRDIRRNPGSGKEDAPVTDCRVWASGRGGMDYSRWPHAILVNLGPYLCSYPRVAYTNQVAGVSWEGGKFRASSEV